MCSRGHAPAKTEGSEDPPESLGLMHSSFGGSSTPEAPEHASGTGQAWSALHGGPGPMPVPEGPLCSPWPWAAQGWGSLSPPSWQESTPLGGPWGWTIRVDTGGGHQSVMCV